MSQNDFSLDNADGATFRADVNAALQALATLSSGASAPSTTYPYMLWADTTNDLLKQRNGANSAWIIRGDLTSNYFGIGHQIGQCRLEYTDADTVTLKPYNGNRLFINGTFAAIPSSAPTLSATSLTPSTLYYIYAYMNSGTMTLEASTTAYATDSTYGHKIKSGDATRTLVGMVRPITGPAFANSSTQRFVRTWFNRPRINLINNAIASSQTTTSTSFVEVSSSARIEFLVWADELIEFNIQALISNSGASVSLVTIGIDGTSSIGGTAVYSGTTLAPFTCNRAETLSEGYHYATAAFGVTAASTATVGAAAAYPMLVLGRIG